MPGMIEIVHGGKESNPLHETLNETIEIDPITLIFGVLSGIIVGSLLWYFGLA